MKSVMILYTERELTPNQEFISEEQIRMIEGILIRDSWEVVTVRYRPEAINRAVTEFRADVVFNLAYGYRSADGSLCESQPEIVRRLETLGCNCVGAISRFQEIAQDKLLTGQLLASAGIRSPNVLVRSHGAGLGKYGVLKPRYGGCHRSVMLVGPFESTKRASSAEEEYIFQEYVDGPEFTIAVIECDGEIRPLPVIEMKFTVESRPHVLVAGQFDWEYEIHSSNHLGLGDLAKMAFRALGLRDYTRIDVRVDRHGPVILDVNALPNLDPEVSLLPKAAHAAGISYDQLIATLVNSAFVRALPA